jgi:hypothetical protein
MSSLASVSDRTLAALANTGSSSSGPVALIISFGVNWSKELTEVDVQ